MSSNEIDIDNALDALERDAKDRANDNAAAAREEAERNRPPVICLGMEGNTHVLYSPRNRKVHKLPTDKITQPHLLLISNKNSWIIDLAINYYCGIIAA